MPVSTGAVPAVPNNASHLTLSISLQLPGRSILVFNIIDSGACSCFMDLSFAVQCEIPLQPRSRRMSVHLADGTTIKFGLVTQETALLTTVMADGYQELLLDAITSPLFPRILGLTWLLAYNPSINWVMGDIKL